MMSQIKCLISVLCPHLEVIKQTHTQHKHTHTTQTPAHTHTCHTCTDSVTQTSQLL